MKISKPGYYDLFRCLAGSCPDSCCQEWDVQIDRDSADKYLTLNGPLGDQLRRFLKQENDEYYLQILDHRCPMWRQDGLCQIQAELGEAGLCKVCREFPRLCHDYGSFQELGLELSCPEAARLILTSPEQMPLVQTVPGGTDPDYDEEAMEILLRSRQQALDILESYPLPDALALLLLYGYLVQYELDGGEAARWDPAAELELALQAAGECSWKSLTDFYAGLEILTPRWTTLLKAPAAVTNFPACLSRMVRCCIERYWLQAVSDYDLVCRVKMIIAGTLLAGYLGGDPIITVQLYSKEIDNSIDNLEAILDAAYTHPALTDRHLLGLISTIRQAPPYTP